jgi:hypothetical protein
MTGPWEEKIMMTQMTMVQGINEVVHGLLFALVCGCRQTGAHAGDPPSRHSGGTCSASRIEEGVVGERNITLSSGQMLLPGIAEPYRWEFGGKRQDASVRRNG